MKSIIFLLTTTLLFSTQSWAQTCDEQDTLFKAETSFKCLDEEGTSICMNFGYHDNVKLDGMRIFEDGNKDGNDYMIFNDPVFGACNLTLGFKACTHEYVKKTSSGYKAFRKKTPDVWDARKSVVKFELDAATGEATLEGQVFHPGGELANQFVNKYSNCTAE